MSGVNNLGYGLIWSSRNNEFGNTFVINGRGSYKIYFKRKGKAFELVPWGKSKIVKVGGDNILAVERKGNILNYYINGEKVYSTEVHFPFGSKIGLFVRSNIEIEVDHLIVKQDNWTFDKELNLVEISEDEKNYTKENLGENINSEYREKAPKISADGKTIYYSRNNHPGNGKKPDRSKIWYSTLGEDGN